MGTISVAILLLMIVGSSCTEQFYDSGPKNLTECEATTYAAIEQILYYQSYLLFFMVSIAFLANLTFLCIFIINCAIKKTVHQRLLFAANRSVGDIITSFVAFLFLQMNFRESCDGCLLDHTSNVNRHALPIVLTMDFWTVTLSYTGVTLLAGYAAKDPLHSMYVTVVKSSHIGYLLAISWAVIILLIGSSYEIQWIAHEGNTGNSTYDESFAGNDTGEAIPVWTVDILNTHGMTFLMRNQFRHSTGHTWMSSLCSEVDQKQPFLMSLLAIAVPQFLIGMALFSYGMVANAVWRRKHDIPINADRRTRTTTSITASTPREVGVNQLRFINVAVKSFLQFIRVNGQGIHLLLFLGSFLVMGSNYVNISYFKDACNSDDTSCEPVKSKYLYCLLTIGSTFAWFCRMIVDPIIDMIVETVPAPRSTTSRVVEKQHAHKVEEDLRTLNSNVGHLLKTTNDLVEKLLARDDPTNQSTSSQVTEPLLSNRNGTMQRCFVQPPGVVMNHIQHNLNDAQRQLLPRNGKMRKAKLEADLKLLKESVNHILDDVIYVKTHFLQNTSNSNTTADVESFV